ncbi:NADH-quinone oxidoreductase subunit A [bacterium]|nr:NADH-quinone oxidoreductase subunit A [candidate division CSSED10-310 bacterium]
MASDYLPILLIFLFALVMTGAMIALSELFGPKHRTKVKGEEFECGNPPGDSARKRIPVQFFLVAMIFLLFDIEMVYLFPWAILFRRLGLFGVVEMTVFLGVLVTGLVYCWRKGGLDWV